uniref:Transmembrane protein n=1 Tax=Medicago truncatula TaxID=3880 RepID=A2Q6B5_MEDTR|nr:hypothetical protein MtrDRAFT_AC174467g2v1 [Medicago truncatula]
MRLIAAFIAFDLIISHSSRLFAPKENVGDNVSESTPFMMSEDVTESNHWQQIKILTMILRNLRIIKN